jgi:phosphoribosylglycinamide formyltransferase-1
MQSIVILISGSGSNMAAIIKASLTQNWEKKLQAKIAAVISNRPDAKGLAIAKAAGIATHVVDHKEFSERTEFEAKLRQVIDQYQPDLIVLAGFMRILSGSFTGQYPQKIINIHPSLLPAFTGLHTHERALQMGCKFAGATVHWVIEELDAGSIIDQAMVPVLATDTADDLAARVLSQEHMMYPKVIAQILATKLT